MTRFKDLYTDKTCVITGAASGIGLALSEALLKTGAFVLMADRDYQSLEMAQARFAAYPRHVSQAVIDVTDASQVAQMIETAIAWRGSIDYLFNNAGIGGTLPIGDATIEHWQRIVNLNLWGVIYGIQAVLPVMRRQGHGHIINTASISGVIPIPGQALYNTTKYAVVGLSESLRLELEPDGIGVTVVCPGPVVSKIWGTPILGDRVEAIPPKNAIPAEEAAPIILAGVARKAGIVVLPSSDLWSWRLYRWFPGLVESTLRQIAQQRRQSSRTPNSNDGR